MFRPAIAPVFWCVSTSAAAFGIPFGLVLIGLEGGWQAAWRLAPHAVAIGGVVAILWATLWALLLHFLFPTRLSSDGVSGYSFWGLRRFIAWEHISKARSCRFLNLRWMRLYSSCDGKVSYMAEFPSDSDGFRAELHRLAPTQCPIFKYIQ